MGVQSQFPVNLIKFHVLLQFSRPQVPNFNKLLCATDQFSCSCAQTRYFSSAPNPTNPTKKKKSKQTKIQVILHLFQNRYEFKATESPHKVSEKSKKSKSP